VGEWVEGGREVYNMDAMDAGIKAKFCFDPVSTVVREGNLLTYQIAVLAGGKGLSNPD
jgi:hypothetical protein